MKINLTRKALASALEQLARVIPTRSSNPTLTAVHVQVVPAGLQLSGTNLEVDLRLTVDAEVPLSADAEFAVPAHLWAQTVAKLGGELVSLEFKGSELHIGSGGSHTKIQTVADLPPRLTFPAHDQGLPVPQADLMLSLRSVLYAASTEAYQAILRGVLIQFDPTRIRAVGSDGYRVALREGAAAKGLTVPTTVIVPRRNLEELAARLDTDRPCHLHFGDGLISLTRPDLALNAKLLDGDFPEYERVIPRNIRLTVTVAGAALAEAVDRVSLYADKAANKRVELIFAEGRITLNAESEYGRSIDEVQATLEGETPLTVPFNARFLLDALKQMKDGDVRIELAGNTTPALFKSTGDAGQLAVLVALRV